MWFLEWLNGIYQNEFFLFVLLFLAGLALCLSAVCACCFRSTGMFAGFAAIIIGCVGGEIVNGQVSLRSGAIGAFALLALAGGLYVLLFLILLVCKKVEERQRRRAEIARKVRYTLPDRENEYVRSRLNTTLHELDTDMGGVKGVKRPIKLGYAKELLAEVRGVALSPAERLQAEEMNKAFGAYFSKERWTAEDVRAVNELCSALLKLCAKYAV